MCTAEHDVLHCILLHCIADSNQNTLPNPPYTYNVGDLHCERNALSVAEDLVQVLRAKDVPQRRLRDGNH